MNFSFTFNVLLVLYMNELLVHYQPIETKHRQLSEVSQRRTASRLLFNNMQIYSVNDLLRPLHINVLYHRVRSGRWESIPARERERRENGQHWQGVGADQYRECYGMWWRVHGREYVARKAARPEELLPKISRPNRVEMGLPPTTSPKHFSRISG